MPQVAKLSAIQNAVKLEKDIVVEDANRTEPAIVIARAGDWALFTDDGTFKGFVDEKEFREKYSVI